MNKFMTMGRLTRDPEIRYSQGENSMAIARFSLAVNKRNKSKEGETADFFNCVAFGKMAEFIQKYMKQGTKIVASGRMENNNYINKEGQKVYSFNYVMEEVNFAESKAKAGDQEEPVDGSEFATQEEEDGELPF